MLGRILEATINNARAEFGIGVQIGDAVAVRVDDTEYRARIDHLETSPTSGLVGYIIFIERPHRPPKIYTPIIKRVEDAKGILALGKDYRGNDITIDLNPLFNHLLQVGMTQVGKTHSMIALLEELAKHGVPAIVFDTQGECVNLPQTFKNVKLMEYVSTPDLISHLQAHEIIVLNLLGLSNADKAERLASILHPFIIEKERDYAQAENNFALLNIPPTLIFIDEAEVYCPKVGIRPKWAHRSALACEEIAKRGSKLGLGLIVATQRIINLSIDVRDNCNSIMAFRVVGRSNRNTLGQMSLFTRGSLSRLKGLMRGECILLGLMTGGGARTIKVRDIETQKAKNVNFEAMLGLDTRNTVTEYKPAIIVQNGNVVDTGTNETIITETEKVLEGDQQVFEADEGDGVILRTEPLPQELIDEIQSQESEDQRSYTKLPFDTHLTDDDEEMIEELRKLNDENNL